MATLTIDMSGGLGQNAQGNQNSRNSYAANGMTVAGVFNPFVRVGYLSPAPGTFTSVTLDQTQSARFASSLYDSVNDDFYLAELGGQLFKGDTTTDTSLNRLLSLGGTNIIRDLDIYTVNGVRKMFVLYNTDSSGGHAEIAISPLPYDTATDDLTWLTATVTGKFTNTSEGDLFMVVSDNGFAYIMMENQVHKLDGTVNGGANGTITPNALLFPTTFRLVDAVDWRGFIYIALHESRVDTRTSVAPSITGHIKCGVYIWDRSTTTSGSNDYIPIPQAQIIHKIYVSSTGKLRAIITSTSGTTDIIQYNGAAFETLFTIGFNSYPVFRDSMSTIGSMDYWLGKNGTFYGYGSLYGSQEALYPFSSIYNIGSNTGSAVLTAVGNYSTAPGIYFDYLSNSSTAVPSRMTLPMYPGQIGAGVTKTAVSTTYPTVFLPEMSNVHHITIYMYNGSASGSNTAGTVKIYFNNSNTVWASKTVTRDDIGKGYVRIEVNKSYINSIQLEVSWPSEDISSSNDFAPAMAIVAYEPTNTKG